MTKLLFILLMTSVLFAATPKINSSTTNQQETDPAAISDFRQIPNITDKEIAAIEKALATQDTFSYGVMTGVENYVKPDGSINGFSVFMSDLLSKLFHKKFVVKLYEWDELLNGLKDNSIDFTPTLTPTAERKASSYMTDPFARRTISMFRPFAVRSIQEIAEERAPIVAFLAGSTSYGLTRDHLRNADYRIVFLNSLKEVTEAFENNQIDAFVEETVDVAYFDGTINMVARELSQAALSPVAISTQNAKFLPIITALDKFFTENNLKYITQIYNQKFAEYNIYKFQMLLTDVEREYIKIHSAVNLANGKPTNPVKYVTEFDNYPASFYNENNERWEGIALDVLSEISELTTIKFERANKKPTAWSDLQRMLDNKEVSL